jgi:hypothetical protein
LPAARPAVANTPPAHRHPASTPAAEPYIDSARVASLCIAAGEPGATAAFLRRRMTESEVLARLAEVEDMRVAVRFAAKIIDDLDPNFIDELIQMGAGIESTRMILQTMVFMRRSPEINTTLPADDWPRDHGWGDVIAKAGRKT